MSQAVTMIYININNFLLTSELEKDHSMIETHLFIQTTFFLHKNTFGGEKMYI